MNEHLRKFKRVPYEDPVQITLLQVRDHDELSGETFVCTGLDLSEGGVCLTVETEIPVGAPLSLKIFRKRPLNSFVMDATIKWVREIGPSEGWQVGIALISVPAALQTDWHNFIEGLQKAAT